MTLTGRSLLSFAHHPTPSLHITVPFSQQPHSRSHKAKHRITSNTHLVLECYTTKHGTTVFNDSDCSSGNISDTTIHHKCIQTPTQHRRPLQNSKSHARSHRWIASARRGPLTNSLSMRCGTGRSKRPFPNNCTLLVEKKDCRSLSRSLYPAF